MQGFQDEQRRLIAMYHCKVEFSSGGATRDDIAAHLAECDLDFIPPLHTYLDIQQYSEKLGRNATTFEAWTGDRLVGLVAIYLNDSAHAMGFISSVSVVRSFSGLGIAARLIRDSLGCAREKGFRAASLEVAPHNGSAIRLYEGLGFARAEINHRGWIVMHLRLS